MTAKPQCFQVFLLDHSTKGSSRRGLWPNVHVLP
jgi:hypothetical protein